jgi:hypothetical protein
MSQKSPKSHKRKRLPKNEAETRAELIDPKLKACGWGVVEGSRILREHPVTLGRIQTGGVRSKKLTADYVLEYVFNSNFRPITREARVAAAQATIFALLNNKQKEFIAFVLSKYIESGVEELDQEKLPILLTNKYQSLEDAKEVLGDVAAISSLFIEFQKYLYQKEVA